LFFERAFLHEKTVNNIWKFLHCFSTNQSEAELQIGFAFEVIIEIEMHLHGPAKKNPENPI
jgi:hypothetical protein